MQRGILRARSEVEAAWMLAEGQDGTRVLAGGTELVPRMQRGGKPTALVDIRRAGLDTIRQDGTLLRIGATANIASLARNTEVARLSRALHVAASGFASPQVANLATVGGNVVVDAGMGDVSVVLAAMDARVKIRRGDERRELALWDLWGPAGQVHLDDKDLLSELLVPVTGPAGWTFSGFVRAAAAPGNARAYVTLAVALRTERDVVTAVRVALGGVGLSVVRATDAEQVVLGRVLNRDVAVEAAEAVQRQVRPPAHVGASGTYRREAARRMLGRMLLSCVA